MAFKPRLQQKEYLSLIFLTCSEILQTSYLILSTLVFEERVLEGEKLSLPLSSFELSFLFALQPALPASDFHLLFQFFLFSPHWLLGSNLHFQLPLQFSFSHLPFSLAILC